MAALRRHILALLTLFSVCITLPLAAHAEEDIILLTYHTAPPFVTGPKKGLTYELADYLAQKSNGRYRFTIQLAHKPEVDRLLRLGEAYVVPWANPASLRDWARTKYLWSYGYLIGADVVVYNPKDPVLYAGPESVTGKRFVGIDHQRYKGLDEMAEAQQLTNLDVDSPEKALRTVLNGKADFTVMPAITARLLLRRMGLTQRLKIAEEPHSVYQRHFMISQWNTELHEFLQLMVETMHDDKKWHKILNRYGMHDLLAPLPEPVLRQWPEGSGTLDEADQTEQEAAAETSSTAAPKRVSN